MNSLKLYFLTFLLVSATSYNQIKAQEGEKESPITVGADFVTTYVWRGSAFSGPSIQPSVDFTKGGFSIGAWGSQGYDGFQEADLYVSYGFDFGLSLGLSDYYYPGTEYFDYSDSTGAHAFEINGGYEIGGFSLSANYILNEAGGAGSAGGDIYFELGYSFDILDVFIAAGDGWHSADPDEFTVCNIGITASKDIAVTDKFSLPMFGSLILNPDKEQFFIVAGISF